MKVGIIADIGNMGIEDFIKIWALQKILIENEAKPLIVNHEKKKKEATIQIENIKPPTGGMFKNLFHKNDKKSDDKVLYNPMSERISEYFSSVEGPSILKENQGVYQFMDQYLVVDEEMWKELNQDPMDVYAEAAYLEDACIFVNQNEYHEISEKPSFKDKYLFVDIKHMTQEKKEFIEKLAKEKKLGIVNNTMKTKFAKTIATYEDSEPEKYLGFVWQADMVITDYLFSGLVASMHEKEFVVIGTEDTKVQELLGKLKLSNHYLPNIKDYQAEKSAAIHNKPAFRMAIQDYRKEMKRQLRFILKLEIDSIVDCPTKILRSECCGCSACKEVCPKEAITMKEDAEGFLYPVVDKEKCVDCNLCCKACVKKENSQTVSYESNYPKLLAAINKQEEVRMGSSSGGIFPELVNYTINEKHGYVVGVKFDKNMRAVSDIADTLEGASAFYGAKYVKSDFSSVFRRIKDLLADGKFVLYSGLPCEAAALKAYLRKPYENLFICEVLCHASPSPKVFKHYLEYLRQKFGDDVVNFKFRDKSSGWLAENNKIVIEFKNREPLVINSRKNNYYRSFVKDIIVRPGCSNCSYVYDQRVGDITLGDFWGIQKIDPDMFDNKGTSILMINTPKGEEVWKQISDKFTTKESDMVTAFKFNHKKPILIKDERNDFFKSFGKENVDKLLRKYNDLKQ